ncbi:MULTISPECIES: hypothetical protein [Haloarcula]|uniref:hypothetical protein n=1 Tax=Haloarcula TaxID=2237 RepID=UPI0023E8734C|nr:hypothetical protein [Halomicroarcula sp. SHR3]
MSKQAIFTRRALLTVGAGACAALAGCGGDGAPTETAPGTDAEQQPTDSPGSDTVDGSGAVEFDYPSGTSESGVENETLRFAHQEKVEAAGSATRTTESTHGSLATTDVEKFDDEGNLFSEYRGQLVTQQSWVPADEDVEYVRVEKGDQTAYRIEDPVGGTGGVATLGDTFVFLETVWGPAETVVETDDGPAVRYESDEVDTGDERISNTISSYDATLTVTEEGYIREFTFDVTEGESGESTDQSMTTTLSDVGETDLSVPTWLETARSDGVQFEASVRSDGAVFVLSMKNGMVPADATVELEDDQARKNGALLTSLSPGDTLYVGFSESDELLVHTDEPPADARSLSGRADISIKADLLLFKDFAEP